MGEPVGNLRDGRPRISMVPIGIRALDKLSMFFILA